MVGWSALITILSLCALAHVMEAALTSHVQPHGALAHNMSGQEVARNKRCGKYRTNSLEGNVTSEHKNPEITLKPGPSLLQMEFLP